MIAVEQARDDLADDELARIDAAGMSSRHLRIALREREGLRQRLASATDAARAAIDERNDALAQVAQLNGLLSGARADLARAEQTLAGAVAPGPLGRLAALAAVLVPTDAGDRIAWTVGSTRAGDGRWCAAALGVEESGIPGWEAEGDTPDEALAALVRHVEGIARERIDALTAVLGGGR